jgi:3-oxoacyl-[acyl-carrier protein] reductase
MTEGGRIIMIGSAVGERAVAPGLVPYAATKGAVKMFTQALSRERSGAGASRSTTSSRARSTQS